jgi:hypothetical protein
MPAIAISGSAPITVSIPAAPGASTGYGGAKRVRLTRVQLSGTGGGAQIVSVKFRDDSVANIYEWRLDQTGVGSPHLDAFPKSTAQESAGANPRVEITVTASTLTSTSGAVDYEYIP